LNYYHRPERLLRHDDQPDNQVTANEPTDEEQVTESDSDTATSIDRTDEPGGPAPPGDQAA
ncbi:hypothetical protein ABQF26_39855, partial [Mycolicibacterium elephantis]